MRQMLLASLDPSRYIARRLSLAKLVFDEFSQYRLGDDPHSLELALPSPNICLVMSFQGVIPAPDLAETDLIRDRRNATTDSFRDVSKRIPAILQDGDLIPLAFRKMREFFCSFFIVSSYQSVRIQKRMSVLTPF